MMPSTLPWWADFADRFARHLRQPGILDSRGQSDPRARNKPRSNNMAPRATAVGEGAFTTEAPPLAATTLDGDELTRAQAWFEDKVVRAVRAKGYCTEALTILDEVFGKPLDTVGVYDMDGRYGNGEGSEYSGRLYPAYLDSDGLDCWNNQWRTEGGQDRNGLDRYGFDKDGFDKNGFDKNGWDRDGKDASGLAKDDPARYVYDLEGYDKDGYNKAGFDRFGYNREGKDSRGRVRVAPMFVFDKDGFDVDGFNKEGYDRRGNANDAAYRKYREFRLALRNR